MKADGSDKRQITALGAASFAPSFYPDGKRIIFSSNVGSTGGMGKFELYAVDVDGRNLERNHQHGTASMDSRCLVRMERSWSWVSGRSGKVPHETTSHRGLGAVERKGLCRKVRDQDRQARKRVLAWPPARSHGALRAQKFFLPSWCGPGCPDACC